MKATVLTHFFNEEQMLRWWLPHHRGRFDHGILIDHGSTDRSVEVCRRLAPDWQVVPSRLADFDAGETDREVMEWERTVTGWKMVLTVSEFVVCYNLGALLEDAERRGIVMMRSTGVLMVDRHPDQEPDPAVPITAQKMDGFIEAGWRSGLMTRRQLGLGAREFLRQRAWRKRWRRRLIHRHPQGEYLPGRHQTRHAAIEDRGDLFTLWYGYSPWRPWFRARKMAIGPRVPESDRLRGHGLQHLRSESQLEKDFRFFRRLAYDLRPVLGASLGPAPA